MNERDFTINDVSYRMHKIDAFSQFHIARKMGPILGDLLPVMSKMKGINSSETTEEEKLNKIAEFAVPIMNGLSKLPDEEVDKILKGLLGSIQIKQGDQWARIVVNGNMMFQNIELPQMLQLASKAFMFNLAGFMHVLPQASPGRG